jgi:hypothetical protein
MLHKVAVISEVGNDGSDGISVMRCQDEISVVEVRGRVAFNY